MAFVIFLIWFVTSIGMWFLGEHAPIGYRVEITCKFTNRAGFKAVISGLKTSMPARDFEIVNLVAEGETVFFRGNMNVTLANGKKVSARDITYYRLADGKILEDEPISSPPLTELLASMMPPKSGS